MKIGCMPLCKNVPEPKDADWRETFCLECGQTCWESEELRQAKSKRLLSIALCTECALKKTIKQRM